MAKGNDFTNRLFHKMVTFLSSVKLFYYGSTEELDVQCVNNQEYRIQGASGNVRGSRIWTSYNEGELNKITSHLGLDVECILNDADLDFTQSWSYMANIRSGMIPTTTTGTYKNLYGHYSLFIPVGGGTVEKWKGIASELSQWSSGTITIGEYVSFHSLITPHANTTLTSAYHFYGQGDYPSFFGGEIQQTEKDITASSPPTQAELVSALGACADHPDASLMVKVTDGSHYRVFSDGTNWYYSAYTVGA